MRGRPPMRRDVPRTPHLRVLSLPLRFCAVLSLTCLCVGIPHCGGDPTFFCGCLARRARQLLRQCKDDDGGPAPLLHLALEPPKTCNRAPGRYQLVCRRHAISPPLVPHYLFRCASDAAAAESRHEKLRSTKESIRGQQQQKQRHHNMQICRPLTRSRTNKTDAETVCGQSSVARLSLNRMPSSVHTHRRSISYPLIKLACALMICTNVQTSPILPPGPSPILYTVVRAGRHVCDTCLEVGMMTKRTRHADRAFGVRQHTPWCCMWM
ncbi:hypothetical protein IWX50DRAFT_60959 [Phyllosticta citricarpa]